MTRRAAPPLLVAPDLSVLSPSPCDAQRQPSQFTQHPLSPITLPFTAGHHHCDLFRPSITTSSLLAQHKHTPSSADSITRAPPGIMDATQQDQIAQFSAVTGANPSIVRVNRIGIWSSANPLARPRPRSQPPTGTSSKPSPSTLPRTKSNLPTRKTRRMTILKSPAQLNPTHSLPRPVELLVEAPDPSR